MSDFNYIPISCLDETLLQPLMEEEQRMWLADEAGLDAAWAHHRLTLANMVDEKKLHRLEALDRRAFREGRRLAHLPLCWAIAK